MAILSNMTPMFRNIILGSLWATLIAASLYFEKGLIDPKTKKPSKILQVNMIAFFNPHLQLVLITLYWGYLLYTFERCKVPVPYQDLLEGGNHITSLTYIKYAQWMLYCIGATSLGYAYAILFGCSEPVAAIFPAILYGAGLVYAIYYITQSLNFTCEMLRRTFIPSQQLRFQDMFFLDIFTSFTKDLGDFMLSVCSMMNLWGWSAVDKCWSTWVTTGVSCAPLVVGMYQCFKLFCCHQPQQQPQPQPEPQPRARNFYNGFRQLFIIGIMIFAETYYHVDAKFWKSTLRWYWVTSLACYSVLSIFWDIVYDWNLRVEEWLFRGLPTFPTWIFPKAKWAYYVVVVADAFFRAAWGFRVSDYSNVALNFGLSFAEFGRRMMWIPLRIDDELRRQDILPPPPEEEVEEGEEMQVLGAPQV